MELIVVNPHIHRIKRNLSSGDYWRILTLRIIGNFLVLSSLFMIGKTFYQPARAELRFLVDRYVGKKYVVAETVPQPVSGAIPTPEIVQGNLAKILNIKPVEVLKPEDPAFDIIIPKIGANSRILANINPAEESEYLEALKKGVAHSLGTGLPGEGRHIFLFAHSTDYIWNVGTYNAVFYLLYKLEKGDEVDLYYRGQRHVYKVTGKQTVDPAKVEYLTRQTNGEFLTLQTCWPPGTTLERLLVFAEPVNK